MKLWSTLPWRKGFVGYCPQVNRNYALIKRSIGTEQRKIEEIQDNERQTKITHGIKIGIDVPLNIAPEMTLRHEKHVASNLINPFMSSYQEEKTELTVLPNELRVASENFESHITSLSVITNTGSRDQTLKNVGVAHFVDRLAFKSTQRRETKEIVNALEKLGGHVGCNSSREHTMYSATIFRHDLANVLNIFNECIREAQITEEEIMEARDSLDYELFQMSQKPEMLLMEYIHWAAYQHNTLGLPLLCMEDTLPLVTPQMVHDYMNQHYQPNKMVIAAAGASHMELVSLVEKTFGDMNKNPLHSLKTREKACFTGGELRFDLPKLGYQQNSDMPFTYVSLAFEGAGYNDQDFYSLSILQCLLGGGTSFSAGGPGKGMYSRLFLNVLNQHYWTEAAVCFNAPYTDSGLFGIYGAAPPQYADRLVRVLCEELLKLLTSPIHPSELQRAKNQLKSMLLINLEHIHIQCEDIGRQILTYGHRYRPQDLCARIDSIAEYDLRQAAQRVLFARVRPALAVYGDGHKVPTVEDIARRYFS